MPIKPRLQKVPSYRLHKPTGLGVTRLDGRDHYLGQHGTEASQEAYRRLIAEWLTSKNVRPSASAGRASAPQIALTIDELILAFWTQFVTINYRHADGTPTGEQTNFRDSLRTLHRLYSSTTAAAFGPLALKAVRQSMIAEDVSRGVINQRIGRIVHVFTWACSEQLLPIEIYQALRTVEGLRKGRSAARETKPIRPVSESAVQAVRPFVTR